MPPNPTPPPPDGVEPDSNGPMPGTAFTLVIGSEAFDFVITRHGLLPTKNIRLTMVQALYASAPEWIDRTVAQAAAQVEQSN